MLVSGWVFNIDWGYGLLINQIFAPSKESLNPSIHSSTMASQPHLLPESMRISVLPAPGGKVVIESRERCVALVVLETD